MGDSIGERIKKRRSELNLTQDELARMVGYKSRSSINKIELSHELPLKKIERIADALKIKPSYLMGWSEEEKEAFEEDGRKLGRELIDKKLTTAFHKCIELTDEDKEMVISFVNRLYDGRAKS